MIRPFHVARAGSFPPNLTIMAHAAKDLKAQQQTLKKNIVS